jgi:AAA15 family ATPase/GTPase
MLIEFKLKNFKSFKDEMKLSMVASSITENPSNLISKTKNPKLLKSAAIYGANSSGKSNLFDAINFMRWFVINSSKESQSGDKISVEPFKLSTITENEPSSFEVSFIHDDTQFRYGFSTTQTKITEEWLYYVLNNKEIQLFKRQNDKIGIDQEKFKEGQGLDNTTDHDQPKRTRENALFLSVVAQFNGEISKKIVLWFRRLTIICGLNDSDYMEDSIKMLKDSNQHKERTVSLLKSVGMNITSLEVESITFNENQIPSALPEERKNKLLSEGYDALIVTKNRFDNNKMIEGTISWHYTRESEGTQKTIGLSGPIFRALDNNGVLIIDEFDTRLHPLMSQFFISLFHSLETNKGQAQLIFSTHDTNMLSADLFRRDQIWFIEKTHEDSSDLYSLVEYKLENNKKIRKDEDYEKNYIAGKYGAIPYINQETLKQLLSRKL